MAVISSYSTLQTAVIDWLANSTVSSFVPNFIQNFEEKFYRQPKNFGRWMEASLSSAIASSVVAVPSAYLGLKVAYVDGQRSKPMDRVSLMHLYGRFPRGMDTGVPTLISRDGANFVFGAEPDSDYTIKGTYWAKPTLIRSFASDAAAHWLIVNAPDLVLYGSLLQSAPFLRNDTRLPVWQSLHDDALRDYRALQKEEDVSGSPTLEVLA